MDLSVTGRHAARIVETACPAARLRSPPRQSADHRNGADALGQQDGLALHGGLSDEVVIAGGRVVTTWIGLGTTL
jgi:hypothetical protein